MKRVSVKAQGASIFFGGEEGIDHRPEPAAPEPDNALARSDTGAEASRRPGTAAPTSEQAGTLTHAPQSEHPDEPAFFRSLVLPRSLRRKLHALSREQHPYHTSVRLTEEEIATLRDVCYELDARMGIAVTRNDVGRLALRILLEDYAVRQKESVLVQVLQEEDQY